MCERPPPERVTVFYISSAVIKLKRRAFDFNYVINEDFPAFLHQNRMLVIANLNDDACTGKISTAKLLAVSLKIGDRHFRLFIKVFLDIVYLCIELLLSAIAQFSPAVYKTGSFFYRIIVSYKSHKRSKLRRTVCYRREDGWKIAYGASGLCCYSGCSFDASGYSLSFQYHHFNFSG